jgi:hypothetical protein
MIALFWLFLAVYKNRSPGFATIKVARNPKSESSMPRARAAS